MEPKLNRPNERPCGESWGQIHYAQTLRVCALLILMGLLIAAGGDAGGV